MKYIKDLSRYFQISTLAFCGMFTTLVMVLITIFLFREGIGFFRKSPVQEGYALAVSSGNPVSKISAPEIKKIFDAEISNWKELGGNDEEIKLITIDEISNNYTEEQIGDEMQGLDSCFNDYLSKNPNGLVSIPDKFNTERFKGKIIELPNNSLSSFLGGREWFPTAKPVGQYGILPMLLGTLMVSVLALLIALPFGLAAAIYLSEIVSFRQRNFLKPVFELLAGIPSVVYGFFGLVVVVPLVQKTFKLDVGETALSGSILLAIMALPTIITISEDAIRAVPKNIREASLAMGATKMQTITKVIIPYAKSGILAAIILGIGRAIGETMAVLMVTGNAANMPHSVLQPVRTIPATIAAELGEVSFGGIHFQALFALGCVLFLVTMILNLYVQLVLKRRMIKN